MVIIIIIILIIVIIIKLYFRPQLIDKNMQIQHDTIYTIVSKIFHHGKIYTIVLKMSRVKKNRKEINNSGSPCTHFSYE